MNWIVEFIEDKDYVRVVMEGEFNADDHLRMVEDVLAQKYWKPGMNILLDSRKVDYRNADLAVMRQAADNIIKFDKEIGLGKAANLMGSIPNFGKGRQFELLTDEKILSNVAVFLDENQCLRWLGVF